MSLAKEWSRSRRTGRRSNKHRPRTGENSTHWTRSDRGRREVGQRSSLDGRKQHDLHTRSCKLRKDVGERSCESERGRSSKEVVRHGKRSERGRAKRKEVGEVARHGDRSCESDRGRTTRRQVVWIRLPTTQTTNESGWEIPCTEFFGTVREP